MPIFVKKIPKKKKENRKKEKKKKKMDPFYNEQKRYKGNQTIFRSFRDKNVRENEKGS